MPAVIRTYGLLWDNNLVESQLNQQRGYLKKHSMVRYFQLGQFQSWLCKEKPSHRPTRLTGG